MYAPIGVRFTCTPADAPSVVLSTQRSCIPATNAWYGTPPSMPRPPVILIAPPNPRIIGTYGGGTCRDVPVLAANA